MLSQDASLQCIAPAAKEARLSAAAVDRSLASSLSCCCWLSPCPTAGAGVGSASATADYRLPSQVSMLDVWYGSWASLTISAAAFFKRKRTIRCYRWPLPRSRRPRHHRCLTCIAGAPEASGAAAGAGSTDTDEASAAEPFSSPTADEATPTSANSSLTVTIDRTLSLFGHASFMGGQRDVITRVLEGKDTVVDWPTADGKSLCYQLPAVHLDGVTVVVSPFLSLINDQVEKFNTQMKKKEVPYRACFLNSSQTDDSVESRALKGMYTLVYTTPETFSRILEDLSELHKKQHLVCVAVDEADYICSWGFDFRPHFRDLRFIREEEHLPGVPILALSATLPEFACKDIVNVLHLQCDGDDKWYNCRTHLRENIEFFCQRKQHFRQDMEDIATEIVRGGPSIVYVRKRREAEFVAKCLGEYTDLPKYGYTACAYHALKSEGYKKQVQEDFMEDRIRAVVATIAFGRGIDKPNVARVFQYGYPETMEQLYQQLGRAGRDGEQARFTLYWDPADRDLYSSSIFTKDFSYYDDEALDELLHSRNAVRSLPLRRSCRYKQIFDFFSNPCDTCGVCDVCRGKVREFPLDRRDFTRPAMLILTVIKYTESVCMTEVDVVQAAQGRAKSHVDIEIGLKKCISNMLRELDPQERAQDVLKEVLRELCNGGFVEKNEQRFEKRTDKLSKTDIRTCFKLTKLGLQTLGRKHEVHLPLTYAMRQATGDDASFQESAADLARELKAAFSDLPVMMSEAEAASRSPEEELDLMCSLIPWELLERLRKFPTTSEQEQVGDQASRRSILGSSSSSHTESSSSSRGSRGSHGVVDAQ